MENEELLQPTFNENNDYNYKKYIDSKRKRPLILAILGLLTGIFLGFGIIFSILSLIFLNQVYNKESTTIKWAKTLALLGVVLNSLFILSILGYTVYIKYFYVVNEILF